MQNLDLEACTTFIAANRQMASLLAAEAERLIEVVQSIDNPDQRRQLAELALMAEQRAAVHASLSDLQERDMGQRCYCNDKDLIRESLETLT